MRKRWHVLEKDNNSIRELTQRLHISTVLARVLANRNIGTVEDARHFLFDTMNDLADPFLMKGMDKAVARISKAIADKERIVVYGDYDVDGITATALLCMVLRDLGASPAYYIPARQSEGYGLNVHALEELRTGCTDLLITVDCGISSFRDVAAYQRYMDIIITDHHEPPDDVPPAFAVLNPKQRECTYPCKELAGVGVAYTLCRALWQILHKEKLEKYVEIAALGTVADLVPLIGENRILVKQGLKCMKKGCNLGLQALLDTASVQKETINAGRIAFTIAPRLNAAGRISHADKGVRLLLETDRSAAYAAANELSEMNSQRQEIEQDITAQALEQIEKNGYGIDGVLVAAGNHWHVGVIGIAASRLVEQYYRPALVISLNDGIGKGSCRSIAGFNMYESLQYAADLLIQFGGHPMAAGFSIKEENINAFRDRLNEYAAMHMKADDYVPAIAIDMPLSPASISLQLIDELSLLEPYGMGNSRPCFSLMDQKLTEIRPIGKNQQHIRFSVSPNDTDIAVKRLSGVGWSMVSLCEEMLVGDPVDIVFQLEKNTFNGISSPQMILQDMRSESDDNIYLDRNVMVDVFVELRRHLEVRHLPVWQMRQKMIADFQGVLDGHIVCLALHVFFEIGVLLTEDTAKGQVCYLPKLQHKMSLAESPTFIKYTRG
ncbi:single-stranded-DNA-specific exonuclease RecJ [Megasphaera paucivorans]|uniref:Single-stranded-DNA-specific exonuclease RecJ n=1 Tax=Megasphaera paucivorans TaxID=349095 RepID=A0A1G9Q1C5_9FIRM|nr:single-stranded-DNA-specific exonuclease RecJ [Megasphaera paucivorans]SDM04541.1 single-stranded-DNA-specific exonuclease [Megasphaera paucivorans]